MNRADRLRARKTTSLLSRPRTRLQELTELTRLEEEKLVGLRTNAMQLEALVAAHREALRYYTQQLECVMPQLETTKVWMK
jgi:hypothetical protein